MGSLPNLHELSTNCVDVDIQNDLLAEAFKRKGITVDWSKRQDHKQIYHTRSLGSNPNSCTVDGQIKRFNSHSKSTTSSCRRSRSITPNSIIPFHLHSRAELLPLQNGHHHKHISRQTSVTSSVGSSSVRKLIAVVRSTPSHMGPIYSRPLICQNFVALCLSHGIFTLAFVPLVIFQGSISAWYQGFETDSARMKAQTARMGSASVAVLYFNAAAFALLSPKIIHKFGVTKCLLYCYVAATAFLGIHFYPKRNFIIFIYGAMGYAIGLLDNSVVTYLIMLASKLKYVLSEEEETEFQSKLDSTKRESLTQKLFRGISFAQNLGLILGGIITYAVMRATYVTLKPDKDAYKSLAFMFETNKDNDRICGYETCPHTLQEDVATNQSNDDHLLLSCKTNTLLIGVFLGCSVVGTAVSIFCVHRIRILYSHGPNEKFKFRRVAQTMGETFKHPTLQSVTPLLIFIGLEQGFMFADFTKLYVICVLGVEKAPLIFISLGILQSVAGVTLSLIMNHVRRYFIVGVGFVFQACLLLVLTLWKPTSDDEALFYVISAAWGVCNAIWDTLTFCLLISLFPDYWEFPFSHNFFFRYVGLALAFGYHDYLCTSIKLYIMFGTLLVAVFQYAWLEIKLDAKQNAKKSTVLNWRL